MHKISAKSSPTLWLDLNRSIAFLLYFMWHKICHLVLHSPKSRHLPANQEPALFVHLKEPALRIRSFARALLCSHNQLPPSLAPPPSDSDLLYLMQAPHSDPLSMGQLAAFSVLPRGRFSITLMSADVSRRPRHCPAVVANGNRR